MNRLEDDGATALAEGLKTNITLRILSIGSKISLIYLNKDNGIGCEGATALADMLEANSTLREIKIQGEL